MKPEVEAEVEETVALLPKTLDWLPYKLKKKGCFKEEIIVYRDHVENDWMTGETQHYVKCTCTACGTSFLATKVSAQGCHNSCAPAPFGYFDPEYYIDIFAGTAATCANCGAEAKAVHIGNFSSRSGQYNISVEAAMTMHTVRGHLVLMCWNVHRMSEKDGTTSFDVHGTDGLIIIGRTPVRICAWFNNMGTMCYMGEWAYRRQYSEKIGRVASFRIFEDESFNKHIDAVAKSGFMTYIREDRSMYPGAFLAAWCRFPNIENLAVQGYTKYLDHCFERCVMTSWSGYTPYEIYKVDRLKDFINVKEAKPHRMLSCDKQELYAFKRYEPDTIDIWKMLAKNGTKLPVEEVEALQETGADFAVWNELTKDGAFIKYKVPVLRAIHYILKQRDMFIGDISKAEITAALLRDYWQLLWRRYGEIQPDMAFPKNLRREHDRVNAELIAREAEEKKKKLKAELELLDGKIAARAEILSEQCYADEECGLCIRPCGSATELIEEGAKLQHCVGTYRNQVAEGETMIYFVRRIEAPDEPFYTLEYKDGKIVQDHGYKNKLQTEGIKIFENKWLAHLESLKKGVKKHGKRNRDKTEQCSA